MAAPAPSSIFHIAHHNLGVQSKTSLVKAKWNDVFRHNQITNTNLLIKDQPSSIIDLAYLGVCIRYKSENTEDPKLEFLIVTRKEPLEPFEPFNVKSVALVISKVLANKERTVFFENTSDNIDPEIRTAKSRLANVFKDQVLCWSLSFPSNQIPFALEQDDFLEIDLQLQLQFNRMEELLHPLQEDKEPTIKETIKSIFNKSDLSDLKIICESQEFHCHKLILSLRSSVFKRMIASDLKLSEAEDESTLKIDDVSADVMGTFLNFIYTDELKAKNVTSNLLICADKYDVKRLVNLCAKHFESILNNNNAIDIAHTAYLIEHELLLKRASQIIVNNAGEIRKPENWDQIKNTYPEFASRIMDIVVFKSLKRSY